MRVFRHCHRHRYSRTDRPKSEPCSSSDDVQSFSQGDFRNVQSCARHICAYTPMSWRLRRTQAKERFYLLGLVRQLVLSYICSMSDFGRTFWLFEFHSRLLVAFDPFSDLPFNRFFFLPSSFKTVKFVGIHLRISQKTNTHSISRIKQDYLPFLQKVQVIGSTHI